MLISLFSIFAVFPILVSSLLTVSRAEEPVIPLVPLKQNTVKFFDSMIKSSSVDEKSLQDQIKLGLDTLQAKGIQAVDLGAILFLVHLHGEIGYLHGKSSINEGEKKRLNTLLQSQLLTPVHVLYALTFVKNYLRMRGDPRVSTFYWTALSENPQFVSNSPLSNNLIWSHLVDAWTNQGRYAEAKLTGENWIRRETNPVNQMNAYVKMMATALTFDEKKDFDFWSRQFIAKNFRNTNQAVTLVLAETFLENKKYNECENLAKNILPLKPSYKQHEMRIAGILSECLVHLNKKSEATDVINQMTKILPKVKDRRGNEDEFVMGLLIKRFILLGDPKTAYQYCLLKEPLVEIERTQTYLINFDICKALVPKNESPPPKMVERFNSNRNFIQGLLSGSERLRILFNYANEPKSSAQFISAQNKLKLILEPTSALAMAVSQQ